MKDEIIGIAVLDRSTEPHTLLFLAQHADGHQSVHHIPMRPEGTPETPPPQWEYRMDGGVLHCHPSVHVIGSFHNEYAWDVRWVEYFDSRRSLLNAVNPGNTAPSYG
jgi:hypothetical protein